MGDIEQMVNGAFKALLFIAGGLFLMWFIFYTASIIFNWLVGLF